MKLWGYFSGLKCPKFSIFLGFARINCLTPPPRHIPIEVSPGIVDRVSHCLFRLKFTCRFTRWSKEVRLVLKLPKFDYIAPLEIHLCTFQFCKLKFQNRSHVGFWNSFKDYHVDGSSGVLEIHVRILVDIRWQEGSVHPPILGRTFVWRQ